MSETKKQTKKTAVKKSAVKTKEEKNTTKKTTLKKKTTDPKKTVVKKEVVKQEQVVIETPVENKTPVVEDVVAPQETPTQTTKIESVTSKTQEAKGFFKLYFSTWKKSFSFKGRANRSEVFLFPIFNTFIFSFLWLISLAINFFFPDNFASFVLFCIFMIFGLCTLPAAICLIVRRFHDFNKSALYSLTPYILAFVIAPILTMGARVAPEKMEMTSLIVLPMLWLLLVIWTVMYAFRPGTKGENEYGEKPVTKTRIIWLNLLVFIINIALYFGISVFSILLISMNNYAMTHPEEIYLDSLDNYDPNNLTTPLDTAIFPNEEGATLPLTGDELDKEALKIEQFINSLPPEGETITNPAETLDSAPTVESPVTKKNLLEQK